MKKTTMAKVLVVALMVSTSAFPGCKKSDSDKESTGASSASDVTSTSSDMSASESATGTASETAAEKYTDTLFIRGDREYFEPFKNPETSYCTENEGVVLPVYTQGYSGCFAYSAVTSIQAYLQKTQGVTWETDAKDIVKRMYRPNAELDSGDEGLFTKIGSPDEYGGDPLGVFNALETEPLNGYMLSGMIRTLNPDVDTLKSWIREYGAPVVAISYNEGMSDAHGYPVQRYEKADINHFLCVVGWDDDFPAEGFGFGTTASQNGAWLVHNTNAPGGVAAYYWVSYDVQFPLAVVYMATNEYSGGINQASEAAGTVDPSKGSGEASVFATVVEHEGDLGAVGIFFTEEVDDYSYMVEIFDGALEDGKLGEKLATVSGNAGAVGYHLVELEEPLHVSTCTVVVHQKGLISVEGGSQTVPQARYMVGAPTSGELEYVAKSEPGRSFFLVDGKWVDVTDPSLVETFGVAEYTTVIGDPFMPVLFK